MPSSSWADLIHQAGEPGKTLDPGIYDVVCESARGDVASTGKPMVVALFKVISGPSAGQTVWNNFVLTDDNPNALGYFFAHLAILGCPQSYIAQLPPPDSGGMEFIAQKITGAYATITVVKQRGDASRVNISKFVPYGGLAVPQTPQFAPQPQPQYAPPAPQPQYAPPAQVAPTPPYVPPVPAPQPAPAPAPQPQPQPQPQPAEQPVFPGWPPAGTAPVQFAQPVPQQPIGNAPPAPPF